MHVHKFKKQTEFTYLTWRATKGDTLEQPSVEHRAKQSFYLDPQKNELGSSLAIPHPVVSE